MEHLHEHDPEALLAASLYEALSPEEQAVLDAALARSPELCALAADLARFVAEVPRDTVPPMDCDLLPLVRARLDREIAETPRAPAAKPEGRVLPWRRWAPLAAAASLLMALAAWQGLPEAKAPAGPAGPVAVAALDSALDGVLRGLEPVLARHEYGAAVQILRDALAAHPADPATGEARRVLADLEFSRLQRYAEAHTLYEGLKAAHPEVFSASPEAIQRLEVLAETRAENFMPLYALDAARDSFAALEGLVAQYPNKHVAGMALAAMQHLDCAPGEQAQRSTVAALESVRERCSNPVAIAQVNLSLGELYWSAQHDPAKAREAFLAVADSGHVGSADLARQALAQLDGATGR